MELRSTRSVWARRVWRPFPWAADVRATFGQPARIYYVAGYTVLVWNKNLLTELG